MPSNKKQQFHTLFISKVVQENRHAISVYFRIPSHLTATFRYKAGQYFTLRMRILGRFVLRSYSISSCLLMEEEFRICIKRKLGGLVSGFLIDTLRVGDELEVFPPLGDFSPQPTSEPTSYFLYAAGSGITPIISILKCVLAREIEHSVVLFYTNRNQQLAIYWDELEDLQREFGSRFVFHPIFTRAGEDWRGLRSFYKATDYSHFLQQAYSKTSLEEGEHFICGPTAMMETVETALKKDLQISEKRIHVEYFDMERQAQESLNHRKQQKTDAAQLKIAEKASQEAEGGIPAMVLLNGQPYAVPISSEETILAACLRQNLDVPFTCESGICTTCKAKLLEGQVEMKVDFALTNKEKEKGYILTCQSVPISTKISVDFDS